MSDENDIKTAEPQNAAYLSLLMSEIAQVALKKSPITKSSDEEMTRIAKRLKKEIVIYEEYWREFINKQPIYMTIVNRGYEKRVDAAIRAINQLPSEVSTESDRQALHSALRKINIAANALVRLQQTQITILEAENHKLKSNGGEVNVTDDFLNKALDLISKSRDATTLGATIDGILEELKSVHKATQQIDNQELRDSINLSLKQIVEKCDEIVSILS